MLIVVIFIIVTVVIMFALWITAKGNVGQSASIGIHDIAAGLVISNYAKNRPKSKKGTIQITAQLLATVIFVLVVVAVLFLLLASIEGEAGSGSSNFFYGIFDWIIRSLPWVT